MNNGRIVEQGKGMRAPVASQGGYTPAFILSKFLSCIINSLVEKPIFNHHHLVLFILYLLEYYFHHHYHRHHNYVSCNMQTGA